MAESVGATDIGRSLRALRRSADLSQRELAAKAGVPKSTIARIEAGRAVDPKFRTVERLVRAAGGAVAIGVPQPAESGEGLGGGFGARPGAGPGDGPGPVLAAARAGDSDGDGDGDSDGDGEGVGDVLAAAGLGVVPAVPHDEWRDEAGRRYPAHLDVWPVREPKDWPGAWWAHWYNLPPERYPLPLPAATYELDRGYRDRRRRGEQVRRAVRVRRVTGGGLPATSWRFVAELPGGELVGELRAHERSPHLRYGGDELDWEREVVLDGVLVAAAHRRLGIGRRLVDALVAGMDEAGIRSAYALAEAEGIDLLLACGFGLECTRPAALRLERPVSREPRRPPSGR